MNERRMGRRGALSGGLAAAAVGGTAAVPVAGMAWPGRHPPGHYVDGNTPDEDRLDRDAAIHAPFRAAFLTWLDGAAGRFAVPVAADTASPAHTGLHIQGVHPAIWISLGGDWSIDVGIEWNGVFWDLLVSLDMAEEPVAGGWENAFVIPEARLVHPTREALWRSDGFEPLLDWVNDDLRPSSRPYGQISAGL